MNKIIKLHDGSEFEFSDADNLNLEIIQKVANLTDENLYKLVSEAGVVFDGTPSKLELISCLDEIEPNTLVKLYTKFNTKN